MYPPPPAAAYPAGPHVAPPSAGFLMKDVHGYPQKPAPVETKAKGNGFWRGWYVKSSMFFSFDLYHTCECVEIDRADEFYFRFAVVLACVASGVWMLASERKIQRFVVWKKIIYVIDCILFYLLLYITFSYLMLLLLLCFL